jgi:hypothetical protein
MALQCVMRMDPPITGPGQCGRGQWVPAGVLAEAALGPEGECLSVAGERSCRTKDCSACPGTTFDPACMDVNSDPWGGEGCVACGERECRWQLYGVNYAWRAGTASRRPPGAGGRPAGEEEAAKQGTLGWSRARIAPVRCCSTLQIKYLLTLILCCSYHPKVLFICCLLEQYTFPSTIYLSKSEP